MNELINGLVRLQELDRDLEAISQSLKKLGPRRDSLAREKTQLAEGLELSKKSLVDAQLKRKNLELETEAKDQLVRKHSSELNNVKSNDAYKALLSEIEAAKRDKSALEDQTLAVMESIEDLQKKAKANDAQAQVRRSELEGQEKELEVQETDLRAQLEVKKSERDTFAGTLSANSRSRYEAIQRGRPEFLVVVPIRNQTCGGCRTALTADILNQVMKGKEIIACESCARILYIPPAPPTPADGVPPAEPVPAHPVEG